MIYYIADLHFDHEAIIAYDNRPFRSVEDMNREMTERWNRVVTDDDLVYILGDFSAGEEAAWLEHLRTLNGGKYLLIGNHDEGKLTPAVRKELEGADHYLEITDNVLPGGAEQAKEKGQHLVLSHYPIFCFRNHYFDWIHLYGHIHLSYEHNVYEHSGRLLRDLYLRPGMSRTLNIGAMMPWMDYTPRSLQELLPQLPNP